MKKITKDTLLAFYAYGVLFTLAVSLLVILVWSIYPYKTIDFKDLPYKTEKLVYQQGDDTYYTVTYCKYTDIRPELNKQFVDGIVFQALETQPVLDMGCKTAAVPLKIPNTLPPGKYHLRISLIYKVNPIREIKRENISNTFTVVRNDTGAYGPTPSETNLIKE